MAETLILQGGSRVRWLDGSTADLPDDGEARQSMLPANARLRFVRDPAQVDDLPPADLSYAHKTGEMTLVEGSIGLVVPRPPAEVDFDPIAGTPFTLRGVVVDDDARYLPRVVSLDFPAAGAEHDVTLFPAAGGMTAPNGGLLRGTLLYEDDKRAAGFASVTLMVQVGLRALRFRAQADAAGEFALRLVTVPPLREGIDPYPATLTVAAEGGGDPIEVTDPATRARVPVVDPEALTASHLGEVAVHYPGDPVSDGGAAALAFTAAAHFVLRPGLTGIFRSRGRSYVALATP